MKAIVYQKYGPPDVLEYKDVENPVPGDNEVLIKIYASSVTATDPLFRKGKPFVTRLYTGLSKPKRTIPGDVLAGIVQVVGTRVTKFRVGDKVYGAPAETRGTHAEYKSISETDTLALKPANLSYTEAATICDGALTALPFLRDHAKLQKGQEILINGASGAIGSFAVQLAKYYGAQVTGVCSTANVELIKFLGADHVIDYTREDFTRNGKQYDVIFDTVGKSSFLRSKKALKPNGIYLTTVLNLAILLQMMSTAKGNGKKAMIAFTGMRPPAERASDLGFLRKLAEQGALQSVIDKTYPLEQLADAHRYVESGHKKGNVVITIQNSGDERGQA